MIRDFTPINVGKVAPAPRCIPAPSPLPLEPARAMPDFEAMDDTADYAVERVRASNSLLFAALVQLCFMARTSGNPTPELIRACEGAEALIAKTMEANHG